MAQELNYKNILNLFVDRANSYTFDVKSRLEEMYYKQSMGLVEEFMVTRNFSYGTLGTISGGNLVGIPRDIVDRLTTYYTTLKSNISAETTTIQTKLNECSPSEEEKTYIKNLLSQTLEEQFNNIMGNVMVDVNSYRTLQKELSHVIDNLNFITNDSYDGQYINAGGGRVVAFQLTGTTALSVLSTSYNNSNTYINSFITKYINDNFIKNYTLGNEYLFFNNRMCTNDSKTFIFDNNYTTELDILIRNRKSDLYDNLFKIDKNGIKGLKYSTAREFKVKINIILKSWLAYDCSLYNGRIKEGLLQGYDILKNNLNNYYTDYKVGYVINSGTTAQNLVRNRLISRNSGMADTKFNYKLMQQLYIS